MLSIHCEKKAWGDLCDIRQEGAVNKKAGSILLEFGQVILLL